MTPAALAAALAALPHLVLNTVDGEADIVQPDGARLRLRPSWRFVPTPMGPRHGGGRLEGSGLEILDGWVLYPANEGGDDPVAGLPPLVCTRDLRYLARQADEARLTAPPDPALQRGLALGAEAVLAGARRAGLTALEAAEALVAAARAGAPPLLT